MQLATEVEMKNAPLVNFLSDVGFGRLPQAPLFAHAPVMHVGDLYGTVLITAHTERTSYPACQLLARKVLSSSVQSMRKHSRRQPINVFGQVMIQERHTRFERMGHFRAVSQAG